MVFRQQNLITAVEGHYLILMGVRWYVAYPLSYRHGEERMEERGGAVDHATIQRWVVQ